MRLFSSCSQYSWHPQQYITPLFNRVGKNAFTILPHQKGFILVSVVLWTTCNEELWETRCQSSAGGALTLPAGRTEPLLGLLAGVASHPPSRFSFQSTWGMPLLVSLPCVPTGTSQLPGTPGRRGGTLKLMDLTCSTFLFLSVIDILLGAYFDHTCIRRT